jgi:hypothetical protein
MRASVRIIILALALIGTVPSLVAQTLPAPIVKVEGLRQISPHVPDSHPGSVERARRDRPASWAFE